MKYVLVWWLILEAIGLLALPITFKLLRFLPSRGIGLSRQVGLLLSGYLFWLLVSLGLLQNTASSIFMVLLVVGGLSLWIWRREGAQIKTFLQGHRKDLLVGELLFFVALGGFAIFRAYDPNIAATEKPMEFAFINGILRSRTFPPKDPWLSGYAISYYYFGYVLAAMLTRLSGFPSDITFNLLGITLFALTVSGAYSLLYDLAQSFLQRQAPGKLSWRGAIAGTLGALLVALLGNLEGVFELIRAHGGGSPALWHWLDIKNLHQTPPSPTWYPSDPWWWWRASRVIHDKDVLGRSIEVIDEFPFFSFLLGDNHPHVLALPFCLLALSLSFNLLLSWRHGRRSSLVGEEGESTKGKRLFTVFGIGNLGEWLLWAILFGGLGFLNMWDFPVQLGVFVLAYASCLRRRGEHGWGWLFDALTFGLLLGLSSVVLYLPFYLSFRSQAAGIGLVGSIKTRLHQYLIMFGTFIFLVISFLLEIGGRYWRVEKQRRALPIEAQVLGAALVACFVVSLLRGWWTAALGFALAGAAATLWLWNEGTRRGEEAPFWEESTTFSLLLILVGILLTVVVEFIFLKDTFGTRMNTVFKFYYQAWLLLGIASAYGIFYLVQRFGHRGFWGKLSLGLWSAVLLLLLGSGLSYTVAALVSKAGGFQGEPTLDGTRYVAQYRRPDYLPIQWLRAHAKPDAILLEAPGGSYTEYNWVSAHTGIPTLLGWGGHELQWRGNYDVPSKREPDIARLYQGVNPQEAATLLNKYRIDYVYVGQLERNKYHLTPPMIRKFDRLLRRVYEAEGVIIFGR
ncbi:MAG: hypothetical protein J7M05_11345 [Anaerolineae bacterium]|nr:hypothetical protein [Anaerolineae bacterium]